MIITNPQQNINALVHRHRAHIILKLKKNSVNVFEFIKKSPGIFNYQYKDTEFCDAEHANKLLQTSGINVLVLNEDDKVIGRNWIL